MLSGVLPVVSGVPQGIYIRRPLLFLILILLIIFLLYNNYINFFVVLLYSYVYDNEAKSVSTLADCKLI